MQSLSAPAEEPTLSTFQWKQTRCFQPSDCSSYPCSEQMEQGSNVHSHTPSQPSHSLFTAVVTTSFAFSSGSAMRSHSQSSQQANICLEMSPLLFCFFVSEILRRVGEREEIPWLREASPPLGRQQAEKEKACAGVWLMQLFPHHSALVSSHIHLVFFAMCLLSSVSRKP